MSRHSYQPRCKVCRHTGREEIDLLLATNHSFVGIEERFGLPYRSLTNHRRKHLDFDDPAITAAATDDDPAKEIEAPSPPSTDSEPGDGERERKPLFSILCPHQDCQERNVVFDEADNICFNCGRELWPGREAREARWYEESGRRLGRDPEVVGMFALGLCVLALLGIPLLVRVIDEVRRGSARRKKGEAMNRAAGRPRQARATRHFGGLSGGEYWVYSGPDEADRPADPEFCEPGWLKPFARTYYLLWIVAVAGLIVLW